MSESRSHGRRRFLMLVGLAGLTSAVNSNMLVWAQTRSAKPAAGRVPGPPGVNVSAKSRADTTKAPTPTQTTISEEARLLAQVVERRYGRHLSAKQLEAVTREIDDRLQGGKRLRQVRLANHDEPDFTFHAS